MPPVETSRIESAAEFSPCGKYRYWLSRQWDPSRTPGAFICINPSKATALISDQTMGNCNNLAVQWGWSGFYIVNLFAFMATEQKVLKKRKSAVGKDNDKAITKTCDQASIVVLAWGNGYKSRADQVLALVQDRPLYCIAKNKGGGFLHPNRIRFQDYPEPRPI
jgi:hypothetical protein